MNSSIYALGGMHQKFFEMNSFKKILFKIENVEKMHQKICSFFYIRKKKMKYTYTKPVVMLVFFALISKVLILACFKSFEKLQQEMT